MIVIPVEKGHVVPAMDTGHKYKIDSFINGFFDVRKVVISKIATFTCTKNASKEPSLFVFIF